MSKLPTYITWTIMALISTVYVCNSVILPWVPDRIRDDNRILRGRMEPPYQYRVLTTVLAKAIGGTVAIFTDSERKQHIISYTLMSFLVFLGVFSTFHSYLRLDFSENASTLGTVLLQTVIPLSVTGYYMEGDFITLLIYIACLHLIRREKDGYLPLLIAIGTLNREQVVFVIVWYFVYLIAQRKLTVGKFGWLLACLFTWLIVFLGVRFYFGFKPSQYTPALHFAHNTDPFNLIRYILPLWLAEVAGFVLLCISIFPRSNKFYKLSFLSLIVYSLLFFFNGNMDELAKYLPAFVIMIPMALQAISGEFVNHQEISNNEIGMIESSNPAKR